MAQTFSLAYYLIKINKTRTPELEILSDYGNHLDFLDMVDETLANWKYDSKIEKINKDEENQKVSRIKKDENGADIYARQGRFLSGIIESGEYGSEEPVVDVNTGKATHTKKTNEALLKPFYFLFFIPTDSAYGFLILERIGTLGIYSILYDVLAAQYRANEALGVSLKITPLISEEANRKYQQLIKYEANQIVLHKVRKDDVKISRMSEDAIKDDAISFTDIVYHAHVGKKIDIGQWLKTLLLKKDENELFSVEDIGKFDDVDFYVDINGKPKKLSLKRLDRLGTVFDITEAVSDKMVKGYPTFKAIEKEAMDVISDLIKQYKIKQ